MSEVNPTPTDNRLDSNGLLYLFHRMKEIFTGMFQGKEAGKGLSTNDYTTAEKEKLAGIDMSTKADKTDTVLNTTLSMGRKANTTVGANSTALGLDVTASGSYSHAEGQDTVAQGLYSHAEGLGGTYESDGTTYTSVAAGSGDHIEGWKCIAGPGQPGCHAEGYQTRSTGGASHSEGCNTLSSGSHSHAEGDTTTSSGHGAHSEGGNTVASNNFSHVEGYSSTSSGHSSHAEGYTTEASGAYSHAEGYYTTANLYQMHAAGSYNAQANKYTPFSPGTIYHEHDRILLNGFEGYECIVPESSSSFVTAEWKRLPSNGEHAFVVGNGTGSNNRSNALTLEWDGNLRLAKNVYVNATSSGSAGSKLAMEDSPAFTGTPTTPTASTNDNSTKIASTAFVKNAIAAALDGRVELDFQFLDELPQTGVKGIFYFIPKEDPETGDVWDEYVWNGDDEVFELIGSAKVDLTGYYNTTNLPAITNAEIDTILAT